MFKRNGLSYTYSDRVYLLYLSTSTNVLELLKVTAIDNVPTALH